MDILEFIHILQKHYWPWNTPAGVLRTITIFQSCYTEAFLKALTVLCDLQRKGKINASFWLSLWKLRAVTNHEMCHDWCFYEGCWGRRRDGWLWLLIQSASAMPLSFNARLHSLLKCSSLQTTHHAFTHSFQKYLSISLVPFFIARIFYYMILEEIKCQCLDNNWNQYQSSTNVTGSNNVIKLKSFSCVHVSASAQVSNGVPHS